MTFIYSYFQVCVRLRVAHRTAWPQCPRYIIYLPADFCPTKITLRKMLAPEYSLRSISASSKWRLREVKELVLCHLRFCLKDEGSNDISYWSCKDQMSSSVGTASHGARYFISDQCVLAINYYVVDWYLEEKTSEFSDSCELQRLDRIKAQSSLFTEHNQSASFRDMSRGI